MEQVKPEFTFCFHNLVKCRDLTQRMILGGQSLKQKVAVKNRKELENKMVSVFGIKIKRFSTDLQRILIDDMVTAFENRLNVLNRANEKPRN